MLISLIGTGNVGTNLQAALTKAGHEVVWLRGRDFKAEDIRGEVVIVSVKDDALPAVASKLGNQGALVVHTAGSIHMNALPCPRRGVLYPMQTFSKSRLVDFKSVPLFLETEREEDMALLDELSRTISDSIHHTDSEGRRLLHLAAVFASNFANHCYALSADILKAKGIDFDVMLPLIDETARKVHQLPPREAQTGPAVRGDEGVIKKQSEMLSGTCKEVYDLMSKSIQERPLSGSPEGEKEIAK